MMVAVEGWSEAFESRLFRISPIIRFHSTRWSSSVLFEKRDRILVEDSSTGGSLILGRKRVDGRNFQSFSLPWFLLLYVEYNSRKDARFPFDRDATITNGRGRVRKPATVEGEKVKESEKERRKKKKEGKKRKRNARG